MAIAPPLTLSLSSSRSERARAGHHLRAERLVDLEAVDVGELQAGALEHRLDRRHRADAHDLRRHADRRARDDARERRLAVLASRSPPRPTSAAAAPSTIAEELPPVCTPPKAGRILASCSTGEGRTCVSAVELLASVQPDAARLVAVALEILASSPARSRRRGSRDSCAFTARSKLRAAKASTSARVIWYCRARFSAVSPMVTLAARIEQRFPQEILELDLPHAEAAAVRVGGDRVAAHRFGADAEREIGAACA